MGMIQNTRKYKQMVQKFAKPADFVQNKIDLINRLLHAADSTDDKEELKDEIKKIMSSVVMVMLDNTIKGIEKQQE